MTATFTLDQRSMVGFLLLSARLAALLLVVPGLSGLTVSPTIRVVLVLSLALVLSLGMPAARAPQIDSAGSLLAAFALELAVGAILGLGVLVALAAFSIAGGMLDLQIGFGIAQIFDPATRRQVTILTSMFDQLAVVLFFLGNGHHALLRGLAFSIERFPPGRASWSALDAAPVLQHVASLFALGFALAAPVAFCILLLDFALGVLTRNLPQMQMFALAIPLKIVAGTAMLALWLTAAQGVMSRIYASIFHAWEAAFR